MTLFYMASAGDRFSDSFVGNGALQGYTTNNAASLPDVVRASGRYRANLTDNTGNITTHFDGAQGRLDAKLLSFPFEVQALNIGIGTQADSQVAPGTASNPFSFCGIQAHVVDLNSVNSAHIVVGHRGTQHFTVEGKNTVNSDSSVTDDGADILPAGRGDLRLVGAANGTLLAYWRLPGGSAWTAYGGTGALPGAAPNFGSTPRAYVGLITYAFELNGIPFVGTCDEINLISGG